MYNDDYYTTDAIQPKIVEFSQKTLDLFDDHLCSLCSTLCPRLLQNHPSFSLSKAWFYEPFLNKYVYALRQLDYYFCLFSEKEDTIVKPSSELYSKGKKRSKTEELPSNLLKLLKTIVYVETKKYPTFIFIIII